MNSNYIKIIIIILLFMIIHCCQKTPDIIDTNYDIDIDTIKHIYTYEYIITN